MKFSLIIFIISLIAFNNLYAQNENFNAEDDAYLFLKKLQVEGKLIDYNDIVLPLMRKDLNEKINSIDFSKLNKTEIDYLNQLKSKLINKSDSVDLVKNFSNIVSSQIKPIYSYYDSSISFAVFPKLELSTIYSSKINNNAHILNFGGKIRGGYEDWFGFEVNASNASVKGSRAVALYDKRVKQSYTFNITEMNYFDNTTGYVMLNKGIFRLEIGRERTLWGTGYNEKNLLSSNPQPFDFLKLSINYKALSYDFMHGWLVAPRYAYKIDSLAGSWRDKMDKYIAISRLGLNLNSLKLGVSQIIIYGGRSFELAYLNPFLFWESAQRSMNDLDNSFLSFDGRYKIINGMEINANIIFDDINLARLSKGEWNGSNNGVFWETGAFFTKPLLPDNVILRLEYLQVRPFTFSHPGIYGGLTYENNGYLLGTNVLPNSAMLSVKADYFPCYQHHFSIAYGHQLHGNNVYDENGKLIHNVGGDLYTQPGEEVHYLTNLLEGEREVSDFLQLNYKYEFITNFYFNVFYQYSRVKDKNGNQTDPYLETSLLLNFD